MVYLSERHNFCYSSEEQIEQGVTLFELPFLLIANSIGRNP